jgi:Eukaryotic aspartyl protease
MLPRNDALLVLTIVLLTRSTTSHAYGGKRSQLPLFGPAAREQQSLAPQRIELKGGLLHYSGYYAAARVGGQELKLQIDFSQGAITVPAEGCTSCRLGDHRYHPKQSANSLAVLCDDPRCGQNKCDRARCPSCSAGGACCAPSSDKPATCAFDVILADKSSANGTMYEDMLELNGITVPTALFGAMYEESRRFEMPYVDGAMGMAFGPHNCYPKCAPDAMDAVSAATGLPNVFTMCVNRYGGTLVIGSSADALAVEPFRYVDMLNTSADGYFHVRAEGFGKVGTQEVELPEIANAIWSSATTSIVVGKTTFLAILEKVMAYTCDVPGLCSPQSWFRPSRCHHLSDSDVAKMPQLTFYLSGLTEIVLEPEDYLILYKESDDKPIRCVAFIVADLLSKRGVGLMLGSTVMSRYAVAFDRDNRRVGIARANRTQCGPSTGSEHGKQAVGGVMTNPADIPVLTADTPASNASGFSVPADLEQSAQCRAIGSCNACAAATNCSYRYTDGKCVHLPTSGSSPYPYCRGQWCMCFAVSATGWYLGIVIGALLALVVFSCCVCAYKLRRQKIRYQEVVPYAENEVETF